MSDSAIYAADPAHSRGRLYHGFGEPDALGIPARPRPHHPFDGVPAAAVQDAGVPPPRGPAFPHAADAHARSQPDGALDRPGAAARTRTSPRPWRWRTTSATRRSAMPASACCTQKMAAYGGFDHNMQAIRVVTRLENRYAEHDGLNLSWETLEGILKHNGPLVDDDERPGRALRRRGAAVRRSTTFRRSADLMLASLRQPRGADRRRLPTTSPTTPTTSTMRCGPG